MPQGLRIFLLRLPFLLGALSLYGIFAGVPVLTSWWSGLPAQPPLAAVCICLLGLSLALVKQRVPSAILASLAALVCIESLANAIINSGTDSWSWLHPSLAAKPLATSPALMCLMAGAMLLTTPDGRASATSRILAMLILAMALVELSFFVFRASDGFENSQLRSASLPTTFALITIAVAHLLLFPQTLSHRLSQASRPLGQWLALYALVIATPLVLAAGLTLVRLSEADSRATRIDLERQGDLVAVIVERYLEDTRRLAATLATLSADAIEDPERFSDLARPVASELRSRRAILLAPNGQVLSNVGQIGGDPSELASLPELLQASHAGAVTLGNVYGLQPSQEAMFFAYAPIMRGSEVRGGVAIGIPVSDLAAMLVNLGLQPNRAAFVFDGVGNAAAASRDGLSATSKIIRTSLGSGSSLARGPFAFADENGRSVSGFYVKFPMTGWSSAVSMTHSALFASPVDSVYFTIVLAVAALTLAILSALALGRHLSRPVSSLAAAAATIGTGEVPVIRPTGILELDAVADSMLQSDRLISGQSRDLKLSEARYRSLVEHQSDMICRFTKAGGLTFANGSFLRLLKEPGINLHDRTIFEVMPAADGKLMRDAVDRLSEYAPHSTVIAHVAGQSGDLRTIEWNLRLIGISSTQTSKYQAIGRDITDREHLDHALQASKERMHLALRAGRACAWEWDAGSGRMTWSDEIRDLLGYDRDSLQNGFPDLLAHTHPADRDRVRIAFTDASSNEGPFNVEFRARRSDGVYVWLGMSGQTESGAGPASSSAAGILQDVTERRLREERIDELMQEVNHRAKNMLAVVQAVARQTAATQTTEFMPRFVERLHSLAASLDLLVRSAWKGINITDLVQAQLAHLPEALARHIEIAGPPLELTSAAGQTLGMALHELATNASKHGALRSSKSGRIEITWSVEQRSGESRFSMSWVEHSKHEVSPPAYRGFGATVVVDMVKLGLSADVVLDFEPAGVSWHMSCPLSAVIGLGLEQTPSA